MVGKEYKLGPSNLSECFQTSDKRQDAEEENLSARVPAESFLGRPVQGGPLEASQRARELWQLRRSPHAQARP